MPPALDHRGDISRLTVEIGQGLDGLVGLPRPPASREAVVAAPTQRCLGPYVLGECFRFFRQPLLYLIGASPRASCLRVGLLSALPRHTVSLLSLAQGTQFPQSFSRPARPLWPPTLPSLPSSPGLERWCVNHTRTGAGLQPVPDLPLGLRSNIFLPMPRD